jgi:hypothetical protein
MMFFQNEKIVFWSLGVANNELMSLFFRPFHGFGVKPDPCDVSICASRVHNWGIV